MEKEPRMAGQTENDALNEAASFLRMELKRRYDWKNVRNYQGFAALGPELSGELSQFLLNRIYPADPLRSDIIEAFGHLNDMLRSPSKMKRLASGNLMLLLRLGPRIPAAIQAGQRTIHLYDSLRSAEEAVADALMARKNSLPKTQEEWMRVLASVDRVYFDALSENFSALLHAIYDRHMIEVARDIAANVLRIMELKPDVWHIGDVEGARLALETLDSGLCIYSKIKKEHILPLTNDVHTIESHWLESICGC